jgi:tetratricopeptide (TPR) repeat protein
MKPLENPDLIYLMSAIGWLELGNHIEANDELEKIAPGLRSHPDVLEVRWQIFALEEKWDACLDLANAVLTIDFNRAYGWIHKAVALQKLDRTQEAYDHLENATDMFPENWMIRYHLASFACQLGRNREAWRWLEAAIDLENGKAVKLMALQDPALEPLWLDIAEI